MSRTKSEPDPGPVGAEPDVDPDLAFARSVAVLDSFRRRQRRLFGASAPFMTHALCQAAMGEQHKSKKP